MEFKESLVYRVKAARATQEKQDRLQKSAIDCPVTIHFFSLCNVCVPIVILHGLQ